MILEPKSSHVMEMLPMYIAKQAPLVKTPVICTAHCVKSACTYPRLASYFTAWNSDLYLKAHIVHSITMSKDKEAHDVSLASPTSESKESLSGHAARYTKVYRFFGFTRGYNFPLCEYWLMLTFDR
jgi:hypothetical protein